MSCTDVERDKYFDDMIKDNNKLELVTKAKARFIRCQTKFKYIDEGADGFDFDTIAIYSKLTYLPKENSMIGRCSSVTYGCYECKCVHNIPCVSSELLINELNNIVKTTILDNHVKKCLKGLVKIGMYKKIINSDAGTLFIEILSQPSYIYITKKERKAIHNHLIEVAKSIHDPKYIIFSSDYLRELQKKISEIEGYAIGRACTLFVNKNEIENIKAKIDQIDELCSDWFEYSTSLSLERC